MAKPGRTRSNSVRRKVLIAITVIAGAIGYMAPGCPAFFQTTEEVAVRGPGERRLAAPTPAAEEARRHVDFAYLSAVAYEARDSVEPDDDGGSAERCPAPRRFLREAGWRRWTDFPSGDLAALVDRAHLRVQVWTQEGHEAPPAVVVTFGGTEADNIQDWIANLRWFIPSSNDQYTHVVKSVGPEFVRELQRRRQLPSESFLRSATLYS